MGAGKSSSSKPKKQPFEKSYAETQKMKDKQNKKNKNKKAPPP